jgi:hypothetical protein
MMFLRTSGSPPVSRSFFDALLDKNGAHPVKLFKRENDPSWAGKVMFSAMQ